MSDKLQVSPVEGTPRENFMNGIYSVDIPELGEKRQGKVRDVYRVGPDTLAFITTDRQSAYDRTIGTVEGKGQVLNQTSAFWFENTRHIVDNHMIAAPHENVMIVKEAVRRLPIEVVVRDYMAESQTGTSINWNYFNNSENLEEGVFLPGYGITLPHGMKPNQKLEAPIMTPTTKSDEHDEMLTFRKAWEMVDKEFGRGTFERVYEAAMELFRFGSKRLEEAGLILVDTKFEFGFDAEGNLMLIDEVFTPDSSRFWLAESYDERFAAGEKPENFDKEILRRWLAAEPRKFRGEGNVPVVDPEIFQAMSTAYTMPLSMLTKEPFKPGDKNIDAIKRSILPYVSLN